MFWAPNEKFWRDSASWPYEAGGRIFLARAISTIGKSAYPGDWQDADMVAPAPMRFSYIMPFGDKARVLRGDLSAHEMEEAYKYLRIRRPDLNLPPIEHSRSGKAIFDLSGDRLVAAMDVMIDVDKGRRAQQERARMVVREIQDALVSGALQFFLRPVKGGDFSAPCPTAWWNTENLSARLYFCQMHATDPFGPGVAGDGFQLIFVDQSGVQTLAERLSPTRETKSITVERIVNWMTPRFLAVDKAEKRVINEHMIKLAGEQFPSAPVETIRNAAPKARPAHWKAGRPVASKEIDFEELKLLTRDMPDAD